MSFLAASVRSIQPALTDTGMLIARLAFAGMLLAGHGWAKLQAYPGIVEQFPDPLGIGNRMSVLGAIFAEVVCTSLVIVGLGTRLASLVLVFNFAVAAFIVHKNDPLFMGMGVTSSKEPALLYLLAFLSIALLGPGRISLDHLLFGKPIRVD